MSAVKERVRISAPTPGKPLSSGMRSGLERSYGTGLESVRVHTDDRAAGLASAMNARAFTRGSDIYFGRGEYSPSTKGGQHLIAHEVAHTVQQRGAPATQTFSVAGPSATSFEREAETAADTAVAGRSISRPLTPIPNALHGAVMRKKREDEGAVEETTHKVLTDAREDPGQTEHPVSATLNRVSPKVREATLAQAKSELPPGIAAKLPDSEGRSTLVPPDNRAPARVAPGQPKAESAPTRPAPAAGALPGPAPVAPVAAPAAEGPATESQPAEATDVPLQTAGPEEDPGFQQVTHRVGARVKAQREHPAATATTADAQAAAVSPASERESQAEAGHVNQMDAQPTNPFNREAFKRDLRSKIESVMPKNLEQADNFKEDGRVGSIKGDLNQSVANERDNASGGLPAANQQAPSTDGIPTRAPQSLTPPATGPPPASVNASQAVPSTRPEEQVSLAAGPQSVEDQMSQAGVTDSQLRNANEPTFTAAADAKQEAATHAQTAPQDFRTQETKILGGAQQNAEAAAAGKLSDMHGQRNTILGGVAGGQTNTKTRDEQKRAEIAGEIQKRFESTKTKVTNRLNSLESEAGTVFDSGAETARGNFETYVKEKFDKWKDERYGGLDGPVLWLKDKLFDLPPVVETFYQDGKSGYLLEMEGVIDRVATAVETGLSEAKGLIATGKKEIQEYVDGLPTSLKKIGEEESGKVQSQFDDLEQEINDTRGRLIDSLAKKYVDSLTQVNERIEAMREENKGLVSRAKDAIASVINTIIEIKNMLLQTLQKAADAIDLIISDPIGFLGNLVAGVKQGFLNFVGNIVQHLKAALMNWLFGALASAGITMPDTFDLKGILSLVLQILGLTYQNIRARAVNIVGEKVVGALESAAEIFIVIKNEGLGGLWRLIQEKVEDLRVTVIEQIKSFVMEKIIIAGVTWIIGLLNPASAFVKACKAIYDIVMFFVERGRQILDLVNAVIDSVTAIAQGNIAVAANWIENALAKALPVMIGFLASLLGVGGISEKIQSIIEKIRKPINAAIDWLINKAVALVKAAGKLFSGDKKDKPKEQKSDLSPVKEAARAMVAERVKGEHTPEQVDGILRQILNELRPQGLHELELSPPDDHRNRQVLAAASAKEAIMGLDEKTHPCQMITRMEMDSHKDLESDMGSPKFTGTDKRASSATSGQTFSPLAPANLAIAPPALGSDLSVFNFFIESQLLSGKSNQDVSNQILSLPINHDSGLAPNSQKKLRTYIATQALLSKTKPSERAGGGVFKPTTNAAGNPEITTETYSVQNMENDGGTNLHHAETQFAAWFVSRRALGPRVRKVTIDINLSPCRLCTDRLLQVRKYWSGVTDRSLLVVNYTRWWDHKKIGTTPDSIKSLETEFTVNGPGQSAEDDKLVPAKK